MCDQLRSPVSDEKVDACQVTQMENPRVVPGREIVLGAVIEVPDIVYCHLFAVYVGMGENGDLRFPVAVLARFNR